MKLYRFDAEAGQPITLHGSQHLTMTCIARPEGDVRIGCMYVAAGGSVGYHQALLHQLFLVVEGHGWVRGEGPDQTAIGIGEAAFWTAGEWHAAGTETGMTAIVIEAETLDPERFLLGL